MVEKNEKLDYLRCGLEIHQQLATEHKLFCKCPVKKKSMDAQSASMGVNFPLEIKRKLRAVPGELGDVDPAALFEFLRDRTFVYKINPESSCLVEVDEDPPRFNEDALQTALQICKLLNCQIPEEIYIMRKTVVDGSSVSGFQRTAVIGLNGFLETSLGDIKIPSICLEEDSAPAIRKNGTIEYRLDRLGIPLVEIATSSDIQSPEHAREVAEKIGLILRSTRVMRGIGTIRQDINISIKGGNRIEIKGFQELEKIPRLIENEIARQLSLLEIKDELHRRGFKRIDEAKDVTDVFKNTKNELIKKTILDGGRVLAAKLPKFSGLMKKQCGDRNFGRELCAYAEAYGLGIIDSDEDLSKYNLEWEFQQLRKQFSAEIEDLILIIAGKNQAAIAMSAVLERARYCVIGVPEETRIADEFGSKYTRPLPGAGRLYPESDCPPVKTDKFEIEIPKTLIEKEKLLEARLPRELAKQIIKSRYYPLFEEFAVKFDPLMVATTFLSTLRDLKRQGYEVEKLSKDDFSAIFSLIKYGNIPKDAINDVLAARIDGKSIQEITDRFSVIGEDELRRIIWDVVKKNPGAKESVLMGLVMKRVRGRVSGEQVIKILREEMK